MCSSLEPQLRHTLLARERSAAFRLMSEASDAISELSRGEVALLVSDLDDQIESLDRADRTWGRMTFPAALGVAAALYFVLTVGGIQEVGVWVLTNVLLALAVLHGGQVIRDRRRRSLQQEKEDLMALAPKPDDAALPGAERS